VSGVAAVAAIILGLAFLVAGVSKLAAGRRWPAMAAEMGVPARVAIAVPWLELALGGTLVARLAMPVPAVAAIVVLAAFTVVIVRRLAAGDRPPCACFGAWSARPLGRGHVARNAALIALAVAACWA
jgi:uncharacterized membrane protein YphA (DoxX/SURF4 family)